MERPSQAQLDAVEQDLDQDQTWSLFKQLQICPPAERDSRAIVALMTLHVGYNGYLGSSSLAEQTKSIDTHVPSLRSSDVVLN